MSCLDALSLAILLLMVACTSLIPPLAPAAVRGQQGGEKRKVTEMVRVTAEVIGRQQCNKPVGEDVVEDSPCVFVPPQAAVYYILSQNYSAEKLK